jgi:hypothetical protein
MVTTITKRERKFEVKLLQLRITAGIRQKLQKVSKRSGLDTSALARLCLASGLENISRHLPGESIAEFRVVHDSHTQSFSNGRDSIDPDSSECIPVV